MNENRKAPEVERERGVNLSDIKQYANEELEAKVLEVKEQLNANSSEIKFLKQKISEQAYYESEWRATFRIRVYLQVASCLFVGLILLAILVVAFK